MSTDADLAQSYAAAVAAAAASAVAAEPEAQLTVPVAVLLETLATAHGLGSLQLVREAQLAGVRPDFAALLGGRPCRWVELKRDITYDEPARTLHVGGGAVTGVRPEVWAYSVSGLPVLARWLGSRTARTARTARGVGRAATRPTPLDLIRPQVWADEWNDELLDLGRVLTATIDLQPAQVTLLDDVLAAPLIVAEEFPVPTLAERAVPGA